MAEKDHFVPDLPEALGVEISARKVQRAVGGDGMPTIYDYVCVRVRNTGAEPMRITLTLEGRKRETGEVRRTKTIHHGEWSEIKPGSKRDKDVDPGSLTWILTNVEVERSGRVERHRLEHQIAHQEGSGCLAKVAVPSGLLILGGMLAGYWWG